jgi:hypothetical protein
MIYRRAIVTSVAALTCACAPEEVSVLDDAVYARTRIDSTSGGLRAQVDVFIEDGYYSPPLGCERLAADTWVSIGGERLGIVTLGGVGAGGYCTAAMAHGFLRPEVLATAAAVEIGDDSGSRASPLWAALAPRSAQLVSPADGVLRVGVPFVIRWSPDPYGFVFRVGLADVAGLEVEVIAVEGSDITAQLVERYPPAPDPDARPVLHVNAEAKRDPLARGVVRTWIESWSIALPVTVELAPPSTAR